MAEKRRIRRQRVLKGGKILLSRGGAIDCTVRNLSETGACLHLPSSVGVPDSFDIVIGPDSAPTPCRVVWRSAKQIGIAFTPDPPSD
jgi:PilZ domain-containing protein